MVEAKIRPYFTEHKNIDKRDPILHGGKSRAIRAAKLFNKHDGPVECHIPAVRSKYGIT